MEISKARVLLKQFATRHPILHQALLWSVPAILLGVTLRLMLLHYSPYAYWGSDSKSYYNFAHNLLTDGELILEEKRRFLYPIVLTPVSIFPGAPLRWLSVLQHAFGIACILPLAYVVRKSLRHWQWWIIPVTVLYTGLPVMLWYEHELLGESLFFGFILWAFAGWTAWAGESQIPRARRLFWWFFVPFTLFVLTKPSGRFYWPGIFAAFVLLQGWRKLNWRQWGAIALLMLITPLIGSKRQGAWLFYVASFPLTQLDSPRHAAYKEQIRDMVEPLQKRLDHYYFEDLGPFEFLDNPHKYPGRPLWSALVKNDALRAQIYLDLAIEGVLARPLDFIELGLHRIVASANISTFKGGRFRANYYPKRLQEHYLKAVDDLKKGKEPSLPFALGLPPRGPLPAYEEIAKRLSPAPESWAVKGVNDWVSAYEMHSDLVRLPLESASSDSSIYNARPTLLGYWMLAGMLLSFLPAYKKTLGTWTLAAVGYLITFFLIAQANPRYFAPVWPVFIVLIAVPADILLHLCLSVGSPKNDRQVFDVNTGK